jgi:HPr kinase/phosphorylase
LREISSLNLHASAVSFSGKGILILGSSGSGKSKLALALISCGAILIADDQVILSNQKNKIILSAPKAILGKIEARNIGILEVSYTEAQLCLVVSLDKTELNRLPKTKYTEYFGKKIQTLHCKDLNGLEHSLIHFLKKIIM